MRVKLGLLMAAVLTLVPAVEAFQIRQADSLRVMQSKPFAQSSNFRVSADMFIQPSYTILENDLVATFTPPAANTGGTGGGGGAIDNTPASTGGSGGARYSSDWYLSRKYDELVRGREEGDEPFLASAPEDPADLFDYIPTKPGELPGFQPVEVPAAEEAEVLSPLKAAVVPALKQASKPTYSAGQAPRVVVPTYRPEMVLLSSRPSDDVTVAALTTNQKEKLLRGEESRFNWTVFSDETDDFHASASSCMGCPNVLWWEWCQFVVLCLIILVLMVFIILLLQVLLFRMHMQRFQPENPRSAKYRVKKWLQRWGLLSVLMVAGWLNNPAALAAPTTPQILIYEGELLSDAGVPLGGNYTFRFSFWDNGDFEATDVVAGVLNVGAPDYRGWNEIQTETLLSDGSFSFQLGDTTAFTAGLFDQDNLYLQVEVKASADPDTSYEFVDINLASTTEDRKIIASVPYAFNANQLDYRDLGFGAGEIPYTDDITGLLPAGIIPGIANSNGVDGNLFTLDQDGDALATDSLSFQFGDTIGETLTWDGTDSRFEFSDDLQIGGDLSVTGTVNGINIGLRNVTQVLSPRYPHSIFEADGTNNTGSMFEEEDTITSGVINTILRWFSRQTVQHDYDTVVLFTIPDNFDSFQTPALALDYQTQGLVTDAQIDLTVERNNDGIDELTGAGLGLNSNAWVNNTFNLNGATTWVAGDTMKIRLRMHSRNSLDARIGNISINYIEN